MDKDQKHVEQLVFGDEENGDRSIVELEEISLYDNEENNEQEKNEQEEKPEEEGEPPLKIFLEWVKVLVLAFAIALFINYVVLVNSNVPSGSMEPTIMTGSRMIGFRFSYLFDDPERGDIIVFRYPDDTSQKFVKRIIGLPGETVEIIDGVTYIDGVALEEDYLAETPNAEDFGPYVVSEGCYFVMGDNRNNSRDSRYWENTFVPEDYIIGKALFCYWPLDEIGVLE